MGAGDTRGRWEEAVRTPLEQRPCHPRVSRLGRRGRSGRGLGVPASSWEGEEAEPGRGRGGGGAALASAKGGPGDKEPVCGSGVVRCGCAGAGG